MTDAPDTPRDAPTTGDDPTLRADRHRRAMAPILGLDRLPEAWDAGVTHTLLVLAETADLYLDFPLDDALDEAAPVFTPLATPPTA